MAEEKKTIEENFAEIENIISEMQKENVTLDASFDLYNKGLSLIKECNGQIDYIEKEIRILNEANNE